MPRKKSKAPRTRDGMFDPPPPPSVTRCQAPGGCIYVALDNVVGYCGQHLVEQEKRQRGSSRQFMPPGYYVTPVVEEEDDDA